MDERSRAQKFTDMCAPYAPMVYRHCLLMLKRPEEAEDAAQDAMLKAFRSLDKYRGEGVARWLYRIAHNTCLDILKSARHQRETFLPEDAPETPDASPTPEEVYQQSSAREQLWAAVEKLPQEQQAVLALYYGENMEYQQIAEALGLPQGTVKSRLNRAKEGLKKLLNP
ncbi:MAG: sigma-70 family RNA polymerase sigma factor [Clostridia bacterium]|nr:sigma-70 family RNA polymerase sigma factor [Clostridia bacterium]